MGIRLTCINTRNFINKNIKIIFFYFFKIFLMLTYQNNIKSLKKILILNKKN
jgi:hypothetical protein